MKCLASSFADPADVFAFLAAKAKGKSDEQALRVGDNGVGCWGDTTAQDSVPMCALPPDDMIERFGTIDRARHRDVLVVYKKLKVVCLLADRMPFKKNIKNGCGIDLNPAVLKQLGLKPGCKVPVEWSWA